MVAECLVSLFAVSLAKKGHDAHTPESGGACVLFGA